MKNISEAFVFVMDKIFDEYSSDENFEDKEFEVFLKEYFDITDEEANRLAKFHFNQVYGVRND